LAEDDLHDFLDVEFGESPNVVEHPPSCLLAIDGNNFASVMVDALLQGSLTIRVGGHAASEASRSRYASEYAWYEPLLVEGTHYFRTDIDKLKDNMVFLRNKSHEELERVVQAGRLASKALFTTKSRDCYSIMAIEHFSQSQRDVIEEAVQSHDFQPFEQLQMHGTDFISTDGWEN